MIPLYLCEDDGMQLKRLVSLIENMTLIYDWDMSIVAAVSSPAALLAAASTTKPETAIYFLDIDLKSDMDGVTLATEIRKFDPRAFIVFVTTHDEMVFYTLQYKVEPLDYIIKDSPDFTNQIKSSLQNAYNKYQVPNIPILDTIAIPVEKRVIILPMDDIMYIEPSYQAHKIVIHKINERLEITSSLKNIKKKLDERFVHCHKAYIINCHHVTEINKDTLTVTFKNGETCPCSVRLCTSLCDRFGAPSKKSSKTAALSK